MDFSDVQRIINDNGLANEPAFDDLGIAISPITPDGDIVPLGLFYTKERLIVIEPDLPANPDELGESVLLHELGHRFGQYYYNDTSELFAENYQMQHQPNIVGYHDIGGKYNIGAKSYMRFAVGFTQIVHFSPCDVCKSPEINCPYCVYGKGLNTIDKALYGRR